MAKESKDVRVAKAKKHIKDNLWKRIGIQKLGELFAIPAVIAALIYIPAWTGKLIIKIISEERALSFFNFMTAEGELISVFDAGHYWFLGFLLIALFSIFVAINYWWAHSILEEEAMEKYDVSFYDVRYR